MAQSLRAKFIEFLSEPSDDREELLSRLADDERRVLMYNCCYLPLSDRIDPNRPPTPPFSDQEMRRLFKSASEKVFLWMMERELGKPSPPDSN